MRVSWAAVAILGIAASASSGAEPVDYVRQVKPLLLERCGACHGAFRQKSGLRIDTAVLLQKGGDGGPAIVAGKSGESPLIERVSATDGERMPPEGEGSPLTAAQVALLKQWIDDGAHAPADELPQQDPREHWSFQTPVKAPLPQIDKVDWSGNPIDTFIAAEHARHGIQPNPAASREALLRRVYLDLTGLPPSRDDLRAFLAEESSTAYEKVVDRLLASPEYGERWGRHWMDVWRYSDPFGFNAEFRYSQRHIWRWRDWIVESLNADKSYDRMIVEMLAGDEVAPADPDIVRATGFLGRNWYKFNRNEWLRETVDHTAMGFLGLTLKCARCHDHKFDPVSQAEYYQFRAFFEPHDVRIDTVAGQSDTLEDGLSHVFDAKLQEPTYLFVRGDERQPDKDHPLAPGVPEALRVPLPQQTAVKLPVEAWYPALRALAVDDAIITAEAKVARLVKEAAAATEAVVKAQQELNARAIGQLVDEKQTILDAAVELEVARIGIGLAERRVVTAKAEALALRARIEAEVARYRPAWKEFPKHLPRERYDALASMDVAVLARTAATAEREVALANAEEAVLVAEQAIFKARGATEGTAHKISEAEKKLEVDINARNAAHEALKKDDGNYSPLGPTYPVESTGRRLALATWITRPDNPRTARVAVNHVWLRHFGKPLVASMADFGLRCQPPSHPQLLDWLAVDFVEHGWSFKHLHRQIVTSQAYRLSSATNSAAAAVDPENRWLWRMNSRRAEAEVVRDSLLAVAGQLDRTRGGPPIVESQGLQSRRRSLYFRLSTEHKMEFLDLFDLASPNECYERRESVVPQQALAMVNSTMAIAQSRLLAGQLVTRLQKEPSGVTDEAFVTAAYEQVLTRSPTVAEVSRCVQFLKEQQSLATSAGGTTYVGTPVEPAASTSPEQRARENLLLVLLNHTDFVTLR